MTAHRYRDRIVASGAFAALCVSLGVASCKLGGMPIGSRGAMLEEDLNVAVAGAAPMSTIAPMMMFSVPGGEALAAEEPQSESVAQRLRFRAELGERLEKVDDQLSTVLVRAGPIRTRLLVDARSEIDEYCSVLDTLPDAQAAEAMAAVSDKTATLERKLAELDTR